MANKPFYEFGRYEGKITSQGFVKTKSSGNTQFVIKFQVQGKIDPANPDNMFPVPAQYERSVYRVLTENTIEYFVEDMGNLGVEVGSFQELDPNNPDGFIDLRGRVADFTCSHEADTDGGMREKWFVARKGGGSKPVESIASNEVKSLDRLFGKHLKKTATAPASTQRRAPQPVAVGPLGITDDDVPL